MSRYSAAVSPRPVDVEYDSALIWVTLLLLSFGLVMVYSASIAIAEAGRSSGGNSAHFLVRHGLFILISLFSAAMVFQVPLRLWQQAAPFLFMAGLVLLVLVLMPGIGREVNGSRRWLSLFVINLQPSELMKLCAVLYAADYTVRKAVHMHSLSKGFMPMFCVMLLTGALLLLEPDFGAFAVITVIAMSMLFLGGMNWRLFAGLIVMLLCGFLLLIWTSPYRMQRVIGFMDPWADPYGKGYQLSHALIAFGRGEWFGVGLGASVEKLFYLPEAHTDFVFAVFAEEFGLLGSLVLIALFLALLWRIYRLGVRAHDAERFFEAYMAIGLGTWLGLQAFINVGVNMGLLPTKGLTLPLISYGRSSMIVTMICIGLLLRIHHELAVDAKPVNRKRGRDKQ